MKFTKITKIDKTENKDIYHLTVKNNHNFFGNNLCLHNCGYRGEIQGTFNKLNGNFSEKYNVGERGMQLIILPFPRVKMIESDELSETDRGENGHGHTGQ